MTAISLGRALPRASCDSCSSEGIRPVRGRASCFRWGLPERTSPCNSVSSYLTISTLPARRSEQAVCFCGTFLRVAPTGRYPAPCPGEARTFLSRNFPEAAVQRTPRSTVYTKSARRAAETSKRTAGLCKPSAIESPQGRCRLDQSRNSPRPMVRVFRVGSMGLPLS